MLARPASIPCKLPYVLFYNFGVFFVFNNLTNVTVLNIKPPHFRYIDFDLLLHLWYLQAVPTSGCQLIGNGPGRSESSLNQGCRLLLNIQEKQLQIYVKIISCHL